MTLLKPEAHISFFPKFPGGLQRYDFAKSYFGFGFGNLQRYDFAKSYPSICCDLSKTIQKYDFEQSFFFLFKK